MAITKKTLGSGITAEERTVYTGEDLPRITRKISDAWNNAHNEGEGDYGAVTLQWIKVAEDIWNQFGGQYPERDSMPWFAQQILMHHSIARAAQKRGEIELAMRFAFDLGVIVERWRMKIGWENYALTGKKVQDGTRYAHEVAHGTAAQKAARWSSYQRDYDEERARGTKKTAAYSLVAEKHNVHPDTVRKNVKS